MKVIVVGLGAAGLYARKLLSDRGFEVLGIEARNRVGGRVFTTDEGYEAGGEWIDSNHHRMLSLARHLGAVIRDERHVTRCWCFERDCVEDDSMWPEAKSALDDVHEAASKLSRQLNREPWLNQNYSELDAQLLSDWLDNFGFSRRARWVVESVLRSDEGTETQNIGLLGWLTGYKDYVDRDDDSMSAFRVQGGIGSMFDRLAQVTEGTIHLNSPVRSIEHRSDQVEVTTDTNIVTADHVIVTLPPSVLVGMSFSPALTPSKAHSISASRMSPVSKICLEFEEPWWLSSGWSGALMTDGAASQTWDSSANGRHFLTCYLAGDANQVLCDSNSSGALLQSLSVIGKVPTPISVACYDWPNDPFSMGGFFHYSPRFALTHSKTVREAVGRIHFAGEHTALQSGFIEGALESAERAVEEIIASKS